MIPEIVIEKVPKLGDLLDSSQKALNVESVKTLQVIKQYIEKIVVCTDAHDIVSPPCDSFSPKVFEHSAVIILIICLSAKIQEFV